MQTGWECPKCGSVYSPYTTECPRCADSKSSISNLINVYIPKSTGGEK